MRVEHFLADPASAWQEPLDFLRSINEFLELDWFDAVPADLPPNL